MKVNIYDIIGVKSGMNQYVEAFEGVLIKNDIDASIKSNYVRNGKQFFPYIFVKSPLKKILLLLSACYRYAWDLLQMDKNDFVVISSYGDVLDLVFLFISQLKKNVIVDIHEVVSLDNKSKLISRLFKYFYSHTSFTVISHSKKTDTALSDFNFRNQVLKVPIFIYNVNKDINMNAIDSDILKAIDEAKDYFLFLGNIRPSKGIFELMNALKFLRVNNKTMFYNVIIAGQDNSGILTELVANNTDLNTHFILRYLNDDECNYLLKKCGFVLLPYTDISQSAVLEMAFAFSKPLITSKIKYFEDLFFKTPSLGFSVDCSNSEEFGNALASITSANDLSCYYKEQDIKKYLKEDEFDLFVSNLKTVLNNC